MKYKFDIEFIEKELAVKFVRKYHYSKTMPYITKYYLGAYIDENLKGIITLGYGTRPRHTFNKMFPAYGILEKRDNQFVYNLNDVYFEIGKFCLSSDMNNSTAGSQLLSTIIKWMKKNTKAEYLYTLADGMNNKVGYLYQASNFYYSEKYKTYAYYLNIDDKRIHPRTYQDLNLAEHYSAYKKYSYMFRYLFPLNKKAKKIMLTQSSMTWSKNYPKEADLI